MGLVGAKVDSMSEEMDKAIHAAVRKTLQHHKLTEVGNAVVEADLIHAVLSNHNSAPCSIGRHR